MLNQLSFHILLVKAVTRPIQKKCVCVWGGELYKGIHKGEYSSLAAIKVTENYKLSKDGGWECQNS